MPTILTKKSDTPGSVPATGNLTNAAGGAELAINTADKRLFTISSGSQVVEVGTNPSSLTCADGSFTLLKAASASITNLTATSLVLSNLSIASANITTLTSSSATVTNLLATSLTVSSGSTLNGGVVINEPGADADTRIEGDTDANLVFVDASADAVGIGTNAPATKLHLGAATNKSIRIDSANGNAGFFGVYQSETNLAANRNPSTGTFTDTGKAAATIKLNANASDGNITFSTTASNNTEPTQRAIIDKDGNLGLGVTPSAWDSAFVAFEGGASTASNGQGSLFFQKNGDFTTALGSNLYYNSGWKYKTTNAAGRFEVSKNAFQWFTAPSGSADAAITFTQAMTLDASGRLGIGTTSPSELLHVKNASSSAVALVEGYAFGATITGTLQASAGNFVFVGSTTNHNLGFLTNNTERARITAGGEVYIAGTTDQGAYNLQVNGTGVWGAGAYVNGSDARLKDSIQSLDSGLDVVKAMRPVTFQYKPEHSKDQSVQPGFIAQELQEAMAGKSYLDGVVQAGPEYLNVAYQNIIPILVKAIQELEAKVAALEAK